MTAMTTNPHVPMDGDVLLAFATPIFVRHWPDSDGLNQALKELVLEKERNSPGANKSNIGGWHSNDDLFEWGGPAIEELRRRVAEGCQVITRKTCGEALKGLTAEIRLDGWANVSRDRNYNGMHDHPYCTWSGVYYVSLGERDGSGPCNGVIEFPDTRLGVNWVSVPGQPFGTHLQINAQAGTMLMFPSWTHHWVHPFYGEGERISLAFNVKMEFKKT